MKFGFVFPIGDARTAVEFAEAAELAGWDGFFVPDTVWGYDPWVMLTAVAMRTERIRLGPMITPLSRRRPWKVASETATLDNLSGGRLILSVGLGAPDTGFANFGEATDRQTRAELLDEGLAIIAGLWQGQPFNFQGKHYQVQQTDFFPPPPPAQQPRIPVWVVGAWPRPKSMARALRWDGVLPAKMNPDSTFSLLTPDDVRQMTAYIAAQRTAATPFDIVLEGETPGDDPAAAAGIVAPLQEAGVTWWLESRWQAAGLEEVLTRIKQGPPLLV